MPLLQVVDIDCRYGTQTVVHGASLHVHKGGFVSLLGPSGCGKTTILRAIAGFEPVHDGEIRLRGETVSAPGRSVPPEQRRLGMVFQDYTLFPHLSVADNIGFGLHGQDAPARRHTADAMLDLVGLSGFGPRYPHELSGGQQQRVALARAIAPGPDLLLMDEPFSSLDTDMRERLSIEVRQILEERGVTGILVTHDQFEAFASSEQVGVMHQGQILQWDSPYNLYHEPANRLVADFIGQGRFLRGTLLAPNALETEIGLIRGDRAYGWPRGTPVDVLVRPDDVVPDDGGDALRCEVVNKAFKGAEILYTLRLPTGSNLLSLFPSHHEHHIGDTVGVRLAPRHLVLFRADRNT
ncbi:MAG: ABC transporter ATP-binding protein [Gammaproteobacteria bacterium]|nr:MAG: ABC transporter ATP-binding protein [Gammaproteobacteria bacterium]